MPHDLPSILAGKQAHRRQLAALPIGEKLRMLDALRERELAIRGRTVHPKPTIPTLSGPGNGRGATGLEPSI